MRLPDEARAASPGARLRELLAAPGIVLTPGVTSPFDARIVEEAGFEALFTTAAGISNARFGVPDLGLTTMSEVVATTEAIAAAVSLPVIADADTGYGNHLNAYRAVRELRHAGVGAIALEDQTFPKRCGHFAGKSVVGVGEMIERLTAARLARGDGDEVLVARTDAIAVEGLEGALRRARAYVAAGADVIFVEAPRDHEELAAIPAAVDVPCLVNVVEGGRTPQLPADELEAMGFRIALYANLALRVAGMAVKRAMTHLREEGTSIALIDEMLAWDDRQRLAGKEEWDGLDAKVGEIRDQVLSDFPEAGGDPPPAAVPSQPPGVEALASKQTNRSEESS